MSDAFERYASGLSDPATHIDTITPSDTADLANAARSLYVGDTTACDVKVTTTGGSEFTFEDLVGPTILPVRVARVWATGTTATKLAGLR